MVRLRRFVILTGAIILLVVGLVSWQLLWGSDLAIRAIAVEGGERIPVETVREMIPVQLGESLWKVDTERLRLALLKSTAWIREAQIIKAYPNTLRVLLTERAPFLVIELASKKSVWVDEEGFVLEPARGSETFQPKIRGLILTETPLGQKISDPNALQTLRDLFAMSGSFVEQFDQVVFDGPDVTLTARAGFQVMLKNYSVKGDLSLLKRVLEEAVDGSEYRYFDFRFNEMIAKPR
jgi:outer membrane protein assembly factor BamA